MQCSGNVVVMITAHSLSFSENEGLRDYQNDFTEESPDKEININILGGIEELRRSHILLATGFFSS
jgi:hypothetical protein